MSWSTLADLRRMRLSSPASMKKGDPGDAIAGTVIGTVQYMSPEQIQGLEADVRSDVFAFGAMLYEMATGKPAFDGKTQASIVGSILVNDPPPITTLVPTVPAASSSSISI